VIDAVDDGLALRGEAGEHQRERGAQVGRHHRRAGQRRHAAHDRRRAMHVDARAHAVEFGHVHEAVLEDRLGDHRGALGHRHQRHELRLHVGHETGEGLGHRIGAMQPVAPADRDPLRLRRHVHAGLAEGCGQRAEIVQPRAAQQHAAAGDRGGAGIGARLDPVRQDRVPRAVQRLHPANGQPVRADAADRGAHLVQAFGEIADLRLARGIHQHGLARGQGRGEQQLLGRADRHEGKGDGRAMQPLRRAGVDIAAIEGDLGAHRLQPLEVQVDRAGADRAAAGQRHARLAGARQQRAQHQDRGAHLAHDVIGRLGIGDGAAHRKPLGPGLLDGDAMLRQQLRHGRDVGERRHVLKLQPLIGQQTGDHDLQRRVLGAGNVDDALQRAAAADADSIHEASQSGK
ncbi:unnamed protein product, partial [Acidocella sp. C78]